MPFFTLYVFEINVPNLLHQSYCEHIWKTNINVNDKQTTRRVSFFSVQYVAFVYQLKAIWMCFYGFIFTRNYYDVHNIGTQFQRWFFSFLSTFKKHDLR